MVFVQRSAVYGDKPSNGAASVIGFNGHATDALPTSTFLDLEMHILTLRIASRHIPEAGAVCGSSARTDLCGGRQVTAVPTATGYRVHDACCRGLQHRQVLADLTGMPGDLELLGRKIRAEVYRRTDIPVGDGVSSTKTLAKLVNLAAKNGRIIPAG